MRCRVPCGFWTSIGTSFERVCLVSAGVRPLRAGVAVPGKGAPGQAAPRRFGGPRCARAPLRCSPPWPAAELASLAEARFAQTAAASLMWMRADARGHGGCAPRRLSCALQPARARLCSRDLRPRNVRTPTLPSAAARQPVGGLYAQPSSAGMPARARSAPRPHTRRSCLSEASFSERSEFCGGAGIPSNAGQPRRGQASLPAHGLPRSGRGQGHERAPRTNHRPET